jgi:hypothetical protein
MADRCGPNSVIANAAPMMAARRHREGAVLIKVLISVLIPMS